MWSAFWTWLGTLPPSSASFIGTLTGSALGLFALLLGALFNAYLNRRRDDALLAVDRAALSSALLVELKGIHKALTENASHVETDPPNEDGGFLVPDLTNLAIIFPEVIQKLGLLPIETLSPVLKAYLIIEQYSSDVILMGGMPHQGFPEGRRVFYVDFSKSGFFAEFNRRRAEPVFSAIEALEKPKQGQVDELRYSSRLRSARI